VREKRERVESNRKPQFQKNISFIQIESPQT